MLNLMQDSLKDHVVIGHLLVQVSNRVFSLVVKIEVLLLSLFVSLRLGLLFGVLSLKTFFSLLLFHLNGAGLRLLWILTRLGLSLLLGCLFLFQFLCCLARMNVGCLGNQIRGVSIWLHYREVHRFLNRVEHLVALHEKLTPLTYLLDLMLTEHSDHPSCNLFRHSVYGKRG